MLNFYEVKKNRTHRTLHFSLIEPDCPLQNRTPGNPIHSTGLSTLVTARRPKHRLQHWPQQWPQQAAAVAATGRSIAHIIGGSSNISMSAIEDV